jgi:CBS domain-containing protein
VNVGHVCSRNVVVIARDESVGTAAELMRRHHVGDVVVVEGQPDAQVPVGIVTDRDLVIEVMATRLDQDSVRIGDLVVSRLVTAREEDGVPETLRAMRVAGVRRVPVVDDDERLIGILALDDVLELLAEQMVDAAHLVGRQPREEARSRP